jgi:Na+(H+)/acetate symporter ActP
MLGVFLLGMFTRRRGSDAGNMIAITIGLITTIVLGGLHIDLANLIAGPNRYALPVWLPKVAFTWFALIGAAVVFIVGVLFSTPQRVLDQAEHRKEQARHDDRPLALREGPIQ